MREPLVDGVAKMDAGGDGATNDWDWGWKSDERIAKLAERGAIKALPKTLFVRCEQHANGLPADR